MSRDELAGRDGYPPGRELVIRELCQALFANRSAEELCIAAREASRYVRSCPAAVDSGTERSRLAVLDVGHAAEELERMARVACLGIGRG